ncbi:MAG: hypothetical protein K9N21_20630 [Deltaproteobacteria bacterium]|nr:hypothetical protein [Deltaproteobacteria bacterium]
MKQCKGVFLWMVVIGAAVCLGLWAGMGGMAQAAEGDFACAQEDKISKDISPEAQLEGLTCFFKKYEGAQVLHFKLAVKNVSDTPQRYRVHIFLDNGKAVGGLIPAKTKKGLVKPGQSAEFVYPVTGMTDKAGSVDLKIATVKE